MSTQSSTLIVFELLPPYAKETATVLALPEGCKVRFRFKRKWFATDDPLSISNSDILIALRITRTAQVLPLRFGHILEIRDIGDIFYIQVEVGAFVELHSGRDARNEQIARFNRELQDTTLRGIENQPDGSMGRLVFNSRKYDTYFGNPAYRGSEENRKIAAWGALAELLIKEPEFQGLDFLCVAELSAGTAATLPEIKNGELCLMPDKSYTLKLMQRRAGVDAVKDISLRLDGTSLKPILDHQVAVGAYDILEFSFRTHRAESSRQTAAIIITASGPDPQKLFPPIVLRAGIPRRSVLLQVLAVTLFLCAAFALLAPGVAAGLIHKPKELFSEELRNALILIAILTGAQVGSITNVLVTKTFQLGK